MVLLVTSIFLIVNNHLRVFWGWISESAKLISYFMQQRAGIGVLNQHQNCHIELHHLIMKLGSFNLQNNVAYVPLGFLVSPSWSIADSLAFIRNDLISSRFNIIKPYVLGLQVNLECWNSSPSKKRYLSRNLLCELGSAPHTHSNFGSVQFKVEGLKRKVNVSPLYRNHIHPALFYTYFVLWQHPDTPYALTCEHTNTCMTVHWHVLT